MGPKNKLKVRDQQISKSVREHRGKLAKRLGNLLRDTTEIDDVVQDTFAEFIEAYDFGTAIETVGAWLSRVARNKVLDRFRRQKTQSQYRLLLRTEARETDTAPDPADDWTREYFRKSLAAALESLPAEQREVFVKHELEGKSFEAIANETGVSVNTLLSRKRYAIRALRNFLKEVYHELESEPASE